MEVSARGVARHYAGDPDGAGKLIDAYVLDERDREECEAISALDLDVEATGSIMVDAEAAERLARVALALVGSAS